MHYVNEKCWKTTGMHFFYAFLFCYCWWYCCWCCCFFGFTNLTKSFVRSLTLSRRRPLSYRNQSIDLRSKSGDWFLYDNDLRLERVKNRSLYFWIVYFLCYVWIIIWFRLCLKVSNDLSVITFFMCVIESYL